MKSQRIVKRAWTALAVVAGLMLGASGADAAEAKKLTGFVDAKMLPTRTGVVVYAKTTWAAFQARDAITAQWDLSAAERRSDADIRRDLLAAVNGPSQFKVTADADLTATEAAIAAADQVIAAEFYFPYLAHAAMEPNTCAIEPTRNGVILHDGC